MCIATSPKGQKETKNILYRKRIKSLKVNDLQKIIKKDIEINDFEKDTVFDRIL